MRRLHSPESLALLWIMAVNMAVNMFRRHQRAARWICVLGILLPMLHAVAGTTNYLPASIDPPQLKREFRAEWVATVENIDWPSRPGLPAKQQKEEGS